MYRVYSGMYTWVDEDWLRICYDSTCNELNVVEALSNCTTNYEWSQLAITKVKTKKRENRVLKLNNNN